MASKIIFFNNSNSVQSFNNLKRFKKKFIYIVENECFKTGIINVILCSDRFLLGLNKNYLNHDNYTDILTFDLSDSKKFIEGELYISQERVEENAKFFNQKIEYELLRVVIHGILHLCGYNDKTLREKELMKKKEDYYLKKM